MSEPLSSPPPTLDGAKALIWSHLPQNEESAMCSVAICRYTGDNDFYVFYCDANWEVVYDTSENSINDATTQVYHQYPDIGVRLWQLHQARLKLLGTLSRRAKTMITNRDIVQLLVEPSPKKDNPLQSKKLPSWNEPSLFRFPRI